MKKMIFSFLLIGSVPLFSFENMAPVKVLPSFSDARVERMERLATKRFGSRVDIQVLERSRKSGIVKIKFQRYQADGSEGGSCSSDDFGILEIFPTGCRIADRGHEND